MRMAIVGLLLLALSAAPAGPEPQDAAGQAEAPAADLEEFVPSVEVRADNEISFPVDI